MALRRSSAPVGAALGIVGLLTIGSSGALAAAPGPTAPAAGSVVETVRPEFTWTAATRAPLRPPVARYEVVIAVAGTPDREIAEVPGGTLTAASTLDLPDESSLQWFVRAIDEGGAAQNSRRVGLSIVTRPAAPAIIAGPAGPTRLTTPALSWGGDRTDSRWTLLSSAGATVQEGTSASAGDTATMAPLADASYVFRVVQRNSRALEGEAATRSFTVDTTPPAALVPAVQPTSSPTTTPRFTWQAAEPGATVTWRVLDAGDATVQGPGAAIDSVVVAPLAPRAYRFEARQTDGAGNEGPWGGTAFTVVSGASAGQPVAASPIVLPSRNARLLKPRIGTRLLAVRPTLRWARGPSRTSVYNLQIFRVVGPGPQLRKVYSVFPKRQHLRISRVARLTPGACYVWRVWPFLAGRFTKTPIGVSNFCVLRRK